MDGPSTNKIPADENMSALSIKDILMIKMFLEKGRRDGLFLESEKPSVDIVHTKLTNIITAVVKKQEDMMKQQGDVKNN